MKSSDPVLIPIMPPHWARWVFACGSLAVLALSTQLWLSGRLPWASALLMSATDAVPWFVAVPGVLWLAGRFPLDGAHPWRHGFLHFGVAIACSALLPLAALGLWRSVAKDPLPERRPPPWEGSNGDAGRSQPPADFGPPPPPPGDFGPPPPRRPPLWRPAAGRAPFHWTVYALILTVVHGWRATRRAHERERRAAELERLLTEARLTSLSRQLHPHFLFNALNAIAGFVRTDPARAEEMLVDLSELLRNALRASDRHVVPLAEELALLDLYLEIQRARFGERLHYDLRVGPEAMEACVPVLMLQPLVENALRHGLDAGFAPVTVTVEAAVSEGRLRIVVRDDAAAGAGAAPGEGIGLANTRQRLAALYGEAHRFTAGPGKEGGFAVDFSFPVQPPDTVHPLS